MSIWASTARHRTLSAASQWPSSRMAGNTSKCSAPIRFARKLDASRRAPYDPLHNREPQSTAGCFGGEERVKHLGLRFGRYAAAGVGDLQLHVVTIRHCVCNRLPFQCHTPGDHPNLSIPIAKGIRGVGDQVHHHRANLRAGSPGWRK